jgi:hypothetical protein
MQHFNHLRNRRHQDWIVNLATSEARHTSGLRVHFTCDHGDWAGEGQNEKEILAGLKFLYGRDTATQMLSSLMGEAGDAYQLALDKSDLLESQKIPPGLPS